MSTRLTLQHYFVFSSAGMRAVAVSLSGVILSLHLASLSLNASQIALCIFLGLAGCSCGTFFAAFFADRLGRRKSLFILSLLMAGGGIIFVFSSEFVWLSAGIFFGMVNAMGRDRGWGMTVDQSILAKISKDKDRTQVFAYYHLCADIGNAAGALLAFLPAFFRNALELKTITSYELTWAIYALICISAGLLIFGLSPNVENPRSDSNTGNPIPFLSPESRPRVFKFALLSGMDSFGGGFLSTALISYWFFRQFGVDEGFLGPLFFIVRIANGLSHLGAAWLAKRIGLINTMVFTHLPSSLLLMAVPFMPNLAMAALFFLLREILVEMDAPTRQSYIHAIVHESERTLASGAANLSRSAAWALGALGTTPVLKSLAFSAPLFVGTSLKILYDLLMFFSFRQLRPPEEK